MYQAQRNELHYDEAAALGILQHLDKNELQKLLDDDTKLVELITDIPQVKNLGGDKEDVLAKNKSIAEYNLSMEPKLVQAKEQLAYTYEEAVKYQKSYEQNKQKLDYQAAQVSLDTTHALLQTEVAKSEEESEELTENFLGGQLQESTFVEQYIKKRTIAHLRKVKAEKMGEMVRDRRNNSRAENQASSITPSSGVSMQSAAPSVGYQGAGYKPGPPSYPMPYGGGGWGNPYSTPSVSMPSAAAYYPR